MTLLGYLAVKTETRKKGKNKEKTIESSAAGGIGVYTGTHTGSSVS